jgi:hypothetical protein
MNVPAVDILLKLINFDERNQSAPHRCQAYAAMASESTPPVEGAEAFRVPDGATSVEVGKEFAALKVVPKDDEKGDKNFPPHLHAAVELFCFVKRPECAKRLVDRVSGYLRVLREGPDGKGTNGMGQAAVCWSCGHVGLPKNTDAISKGESAKCGGCGDSEQTNLVKVTQPDGTVVPWIELKTKDGDKK